MTMCSRCFLPARSNTDQIPQLDQVDQIDETCAAFHFPRQNLNKLIRPNDDRIPSLITLHPPEPLDQVNQIDQVHASSHFQHQIENQSHNTPEALDQIDQARAYLSF